MVEPDNCRISMRAKPSDLALIDRAAKLLGISRSKFILRCSELKAQQIISDNRQQRNAKRQTREAHINHSVLAMINGHIIDIGS